MIHFLRKLLAIVCSAIWIMASAAVIVTEARGLPPSEGQGQIWFWTLIIAAVLWAVSSDPAQSV